MQPDTAAKAARRAPGWMGSLAAPGLMVLAAVVALGGIAWLSQRVGHEPKRPDAPAFSNPVPAPGANRYVVKQTSPGSLALVAESSKDPANAPVHQLPLRPAVRVEFLRFASAADLKVGDWLTVVGVSNAVRNFSIDALVVIPGAAKGSDGLARSAAGFAGNEAGPNANDQVVLAGPITEVSGTAVTLGGGPVPVRVEVSSRSPVFRLEPGAATEIRDGDLLGFGGAGVDDPQAAILVRRSASR